VAGAVAPVLPRTLAYEPVYPWITGMAVAEWETQPDREQTSATVGAQDSRQEESVT
jgi:protocatechuate 4,5-dioxygenase beta chain